MRSSSRIVIGRLRTPLPSGRFAVVSLSLVDSALRSHPVASLSSHCHWSTPHSAPIRSLRCRLIVIGRLRTPLPSGRFAVVSLSLVDSALRSHPVASLSSHCHWSTPHSAPIRSLRCRLIVIGRLRTPLPSGRFAVVSLSLVDSALRSHPVASLSSHCHWSTPHSAPIRSLRCRLIVIGRLRTPLPSGRFAVVSLSLVDSALR